MSTKKIISWNVNGIRAVQRKGFLDWIRLESPDILCVQEIKAAENDIPSDVKNIDGYHTYFSSAAKKGYSGVGIFTKEKPNAVTKSFGAERFDNEGRVITAEYKDFILFNIYFPNGKASHERLAYKMDFYNAFLHHITSLKMQGKAIIICGDVNTAHKEIDLARPKENQHSSGFLPEERAWLDRLVAAGFVDTLRIFNSEGGNYTWWDLKSRARERNVGWRIDYFFVSDNFKDQIANAYIMPEVLGSDHCPIGINVVCKG